MPPEKLTPIGSVHGRRAIDALEPLRDLVRQRRRYSARRSASRSAGSVLALGREEARVGRIGIGAADERELDDVVRGHHARVARMELAAEPVVLERARGACRCGPRRRAPAPRAAWPGSSASAGRANAPCVPCRPSIVRRARTSRRSRARQSASPLDTRRRASARSRL